MDINEVVYVAIKLDDSAKESLKKLVDPKFSRTICDHMTIAFGNSVTKKHLTHIGRKIELIGGRIISDDKVQAMILCGDFSEFDPQNKVCHITMATDGSTPPVYSNELAAKYENGENVLYSDAQWHGEGTIIAFLKGGFIEGI